jgi:hypothetical protein
MRGWTRPGVMIVQVISQVTGPCSSLISGLTLLVQSGEHRDLPVGGVDEIRRVH